MLRYSVRLRTGDVRPAVSLQYNRTPWRLIPFIQFEYQIGCTVTEGSIHVAVGSSKGAMDGASARRRCAYGTDGHSRRGVPRRTRDNCYGRGRYGGGCGRNFLSSRESSPLHSRSVVIRRDYFPRKILHWTLAPPGTVSHSTRDNYGAISALSARLSCSSALGISLRDRLSTSLSRQRTWFIFTPFEKGFNDVIATGERVRSSVQRSPTQLARTYKISKG